MHMGLRLSPIVHITVHIVGIFVPRCKQQCTVAAKLTFLSEISDLFLTPYVDQHAKEVPKNKVFWGCTISLASQGRKKHHGEIHCSVYAEKCTKNKPAILQLRMPCITRSAIQVTAKQQKIARCQFEAFVGVIILKDTWNTQNNPTITGNSKVAKNRKMSRQFEAFLGVVMEKDM